MLKLLRHFFSGKDAEQGSAKLHTATGETPPAEVLVDGAPPFPIARHTTCHEGYPILNWAAVQAWLDGLASPELQASAWAATERAWLLHMQQVLGPTFSLRESENAVLLSSLDADLANATLDYMERTLKRVAKLLDGIAELSPWGKDLLLVFDDNESYLHYVSYYYPEAGEFAFSGGMYVNAGCGHYATVKADLHAIEPVIAHEMTHGYLSHLPIPAWLNEGLAVNTERRLAASYSSAHSPQQLREKHLRFWSEKEIQEFWSGQSFLRTGDACLLSYDLACIVVEQLAATDWERFKRFVLAANDADAGSAAAVDHLGMKLGAIVCALLEKDPSLSWSPNPSDWSNEHH